MEMIANMLRRHDPLEITSASVDERPRSNLYHFLEELLLRGGPTEIEYATLLTHLSDAHRKQFVIEEGITKRVSTDDVLDALFNKHHDVFRSTATMQGFAYSKPHGYAGDFEVIERIYNRTCSAKEYLKRWDAMFHESDAANAVRNRAEMLGSLIAHARPASILSVGCGPGLDVIKALTGSHGVEEVTFLDADAAALSRCAVNARASSDVTFNYVHKNALRFRPQKHYDLIWASGLFDYLNDKTAVYLLRRLKDMLAPKGIICFGNFSHENRTRAYMEIVGEWFLRHRSKADMMRLSELAGMSRLSPAVEADATGLNLFAIFA